MLSIGNLLGPSNTRIRSIRAFVLISLLAAMPMAIAQQADQKLPIQQQMTPEQFKAAGLDKLNAEQLANLNAWLNGTIATETAKAAVTAKKQVEEDNRGFFNFGSTEPVVAKISGEFRGFGRGRNFTLENGHVWQQTDDASLAGVRLSNPGIKITPSLVGNVWYLQVQGYNTRAKVQRIK
ncbi:MAG: hypothetical protein ACREPE_10920 [Lysobacter sp.]